MKSMKTVIIVLSLTCCSAYAAVDISKLPPASTQQGVTYAKDIKPIFEDSCFRCHGSEKQKGGLRLDSLEAALKGGKDNKGKDVVPGKSAESHLVIAVAQLDEKSAMPPKRKGPPGGGPGGPGGPGGGHGGPPAKVLTAEQVGLVRAWIDQGAK